MNMKSTCEQAYTLPEDIKSKIDAQVAKYPADQKQSAIKSALMYVQDANGGWLTEAMVKSVADYLAMPHIAAFEVASFYTMFDMKLVGKHKVNVCTNISCMLRGSGKIVEHLEKSLGVKCGETTSDNQFTLREVECLAACCNAPMMQIDKTYYEDLTPEKIDNIIAGYKEK